MKNEELEVIKQALVNEVEGYEFYKMAAAQAPNANSKEAFTELAEEELNHINWLKDLYNSIKEDKDADLKLAFEIKPHEPNIFKWDNVDRKSAGMALSVFGIGIQMERNAVEFYKNAAEKSTVKEAKELFLKLVEWETVHMKQFSLEYDHMKREWWTSQEYAPL